METFQHQLQKFDPGMVWLDSNNQIMAFNYVATQVLGANANDVIGKEILQFHPEKSRSKVKWLLESSTCPAESPPPMTMMINIPDRVLLIKVSKMFGGSEGAGTCMIFYDLTDITTIPHQKGESQEQPRRLFKLPVYKHNKVMLIDMDEVVHLKADGHYTILYTHNEQYLCNLSMSDLEERMGKENFVRVHRSHIINVSFAKSFEKVDEQCMIIMDTSKEIAIPVSRSNVKMLKALLGLS